MVYHHPGESYNQMLPLIDLVCSTNIYRVSSVCQALLLALGGISVNKTDENPCLYGGDILVQGGRR